MARGAGNDGGPGERGVDRLASVVPDKSAAVAFSYRLRLHGDAGAVFPYVALISVSLVALSVPMSAQGRA